MQIDDLRRRIDGKDKERGRDVRIQEIEVGLATRVK